MKPDPAAALLLLTLWTVSPAQFVIPPHDASEHRNSVVALNREEQQEPTSPLSLTYTNHKPNAIALSDSSLYKRKADWKRIVDQFWGPGLPRSQKQQVFDTFANYIHDIFPCFSGLNVNWDSLRAFFAAQINDSTSRGGFSAILTRLAHELRDYHVMGWDTTIRSTPLNPGTPIFVMAGGGDVSHFGAVLTPLADSTLLVLRAVANHPLGLQPGDIILGYEGVPWKRLVSELLASPLPRRGPRASTESSRNHMLLCAAGMNWHLFDTIDVVRYHSGALEHLPTASLSSLDIPDYMPNNEQLPVPSVPQPDYAPRPGSKNVSYGVVQGTNTGYIYISGHGPGVKTDFQNAVSALMGTNGLIIDIRFNAGGYVTEGPEAGLALLMNYSTQTLVGFERSSPGDLYALKAVAPALLPFYMNADLNTLYERPIAVLTGPFAVSQGDFTAYKFRYLSSARFFGKPVCGAVTGMIYEEPVVSGFYFMVPFFVLADHRDPSTLLVRREFPVDEPVWFDKDDVAHGDDTVVKRALAWINGVAHAHDVTPSRRSYASLTDTLRLTAQVENPNSHPISVKAFIKRDTTVVDSVAFADDGLHGDGKTGDGLWGMTWRLPANEEMYSATVVTKDSIDKSVYSMPFSARFTTTGPLVFDSLIAQRVSSDLIAFRSPAVRHCGAVTTVPGVTASILKLEGDTVITKIYNWRITYGDIPPDTIVGTPQFYTLTVNARAADTVRFALGVDLASNGVVYWADTLAFVVGPFKAEFADQSGHLPSTYALHQNYPNPFNPTTTIRYDVAGNGCYQSSGQSGGQGASHVRLAVYDLLGREVAVLVNERKAPGSYTMRFDAGNLSSGVYLYRLTTGAYVMTRKCLVAK